MSGSFIGSILDAITDAFGPQVTTSNTLNPVQVALATRGYWFQSNVLNIPDRYGFFSSGPPRLQAYQGFLFITLLLMLLCTLFCGAFIVVLLTLKPDHVPIWRAVLAMAILPVGVVAMIWVAECRSERRALEYDWEDWKLRKD